MIHSYSEMEDLIRDVGYTQDSVLINDNDGYGYLMGYVKDIDTWEVMKYFKKFKNKNIAGKDVFTFYRCLEFNVINDVDRNKLAMVFVSM